MEVQTVDRLRSLFLNDNGSKPVFLLGAGASQKSGIPVSDQIVERAAKWSYCLCNGRHPDDPNVKRSDWLKWLQAHPWYRQDLTSADNYSAVIHHLLQPRDNRREFFLKLIRPSVPASRGYEHLLEILDHRRVETVLTTNFDRVIPDLHVTRRRPHHLELIQTPADYTKFSTSPSHPQLVYLHGSVEHYTDQNLLDEVQRLDDPLVTLLTPVLRDHPIVVIGYRGAEPSIMQHLLADQASRTNGFRRGIFWCQLAGATVHSAVLELYQKLSGNLQIVAINGFDEVMSSLADQCGSLPLALRATTGTATDDAGIPFDMRVTPDAELDELDWARAQVELTAYCRKMQIELPATISRAWLEERMEELDLLRRTASGLRPTNAGYLMFASAPTRRVPGAGCVLRFKGDADRVIDGNLWRQMDIVTELLTELNRPFRLKSTVSESVFPYPPLALKELVVNALVHRSYDSDTPLTIDIEEMFVRFLNPGGLVPAVFERVKTGLQQQIELGARGIRGYRNTVIADLFYGAGAMDKEGSGLPDVHAQVQRNEGKVFFGPVDDSNTTFRALIYRRAEEADITTGTATAAISKSKYFANLLQVLNVPGFVWRAPSQCASGQQVLELCDAQAPAVFGLKRSTELFTFSDLSASDNPLRAAVDVTAIQSVSTMAMLTTPEGQRNAVELLNRAFYRVLNARGLRTDAFRRRCFFERTDEGAREITYQASLRQATRTVTKPVVSKRTEKLLYWQHEAMTFGFERFGGEWALRILPGYAFTKDGYFEQLHHSRIGPLATRKAARDFTLQVYNHLVFWTWILAEGRDSFELDLGGARPASVRGLLLSCELASRVEADVEVEPEFLRDEDARLARLEEQLEDEIDAEGEPVEATDAD
jgi:hypothetical protein